MKILLLLIWINKFSEEDLILGIFLTISFLNKFILISGLIVKKEYKKLQYL